MRARADSLRARAGVRVHDSFGRALLSASRFEAPRSVDELRALFARASAEGMPLTLRGAGRSYGDASLNTPGLVVDGRGLNRILSFDEATGVIEAEGGVTIEQLWRHTLPRGYWPPVVPGTMRPTLAGCVSANVHGKNHFKAGPFGEHILELDLLDAGGTLRTLTPGRDRELFHAVCGGFGLLGAVTRVKLKLKHVDSGRVRVLPLRARSLDEQFAIFEEQLPQSDYLVGWVDCIASGRALGRGEIHRANHIGPADDPLAQASLDASHQDLPSKMLGVPRGMLHKFLAPFLNPFGMRLVNLAKYVMAGLVQKRPYLQSHVAFNFLLDYVPDWRLAYGRLGFVQVQLFVPHEGAKETLRDVLTLCQVHGQPSLLGVLKRHRADEFLLSHALDGWSLALDFKLFPGREEALKKLVHALHARVIDAGGRFYLAKDALLDATELAKSLGPERLAKFAAHKQALDPHGLFESDLSRRVLLGGRGPGA